MRIGQLAKAVGCTIETIRYYENQGLLAKPQRSANNFRYYTNDHLQQLSFICYCRSLDISLHEIKMLLNLDRSSGQRAEEINLLLDKHIRDVAKRLHELAHLRMELIKLKQKCSEMTGENLMQNIFSGGNIRFRKIK
ncbi:MerR family transcriptional regulator [Basfia succiniciproducens]|uniref:DNA-binding transcriptional regulator, MerR family n=1 Tax=Basfia succiniciproducens TaxID=653940 RepID=A0A1G5DFG5_9PAST|nr:MerR family transcriptional regulator [Basfia succiniciproducens]QIM67935.1 MerR family transcriptional regulator [Basfia succiniciproducens]SCY13281.1 DNA-binding transcriptional regulator, MerR family [Basfia succiniciproducens]SEQ41172.1 DNA-binding transcriptional regulator, MerR family [Basfia succiniciproducens]